MMNLDFLVKLPEGEYVFPVDLCVTQKPNRARYFCFYLYKTTNTQKNCKQGTMKRKILIDLYP